MAKKGVFQHSKILFLFLYRAFYATDTERFEKLRERFRRVRERFFNLSLSFSTKKASQTSILYIYAHKMPFFSGNTHFIRIIILFIFCVKPTDICRGDFYAKYDAFSRSEKALLGCNTELQEMFKRLEVADVMPSSAEVKITLHSYLSSSSISRTGAISLFILI